MESFERGCAVRANDEFHEVLRLYMLTAGILGKKEHEIMRRFQHRPKTEVLMELEALWAEHKVQRFTLGKVVVWRATDEANV
jgi:hypothetical protein